jgi:cytochrome c-type biogenesis protein CcmF
VRSGILDSTHAFGASTLGLPFVTAIGITLFASVALVTWRYKDLHSEHRLDSLLSREAIFLLNNLVLVGLAFAIFWGTLFPLISEAVTGTKASVGPPWFDRYTTPLGIVLVLLTGLGPLFAWRQSTARGLLRVLAVPGAVTVAVVGVVLAVTDARAHVPALVAFAVIALTISALAGEFARGTRARRAATGEPWPEALVGVVTRNRRRYGGYVVHAGIAVLLLGVAASSSFGTAIDRSLRPGQRMRVAGYELAYRVPRAARRARRREAATRNRGRRQPIRAPCHDAGARA